MTAMPAQVCIIGGLMVLVVFFPAAFLVALIGAVVLSVATICQAASRRQAAER